MDKKAPCKSIIISGNLKNTNLKYQLCPVNEFSEGVWNITILSVGYSCNVENFKEHCKISCNLSKNQRFNDSSEVELYEQPFALFYLEEQKHTVYFGEPIWLYMNVHSNVLEFKISKVNSEENLMIDCELNIHCVFQRVK